MLGTKWKNIDKFGDSWRKKMTFFKKFSIGIKIHITIVEVDTLSLIDFSHPVNRLSFKVINVSFVY